MSAIYDLFATPKRSKRETTRLHARIVSKGTVRREEFLDRVHRFTGISRSLLAGALEAFCSEARDLLAEGWTVEVGSLGYFSASLSCPAVSDKSEIRAASVEPKGVNYRASSRIKREIKEKMRLQRREAPRAPEAPPLPEKECKALLENYLLKHAFITRPQYAGLTGRKRLLALEELNAWVERGVLKREGAGRLTVYVRAG